MFNYILFNFQERTYKKKNLGKTGLQIDIIDLYQSNWMDENIAYKETLFAYEQLLKEGKIRAIGVSNPNLKQLSNFDTGCSQSSNYQYIKHYNLNLYDNPQFDDTLRNLVIRKNIGVIIYYSLNSGFLTGKYRNYEDMITVREMTRLPHT